MELSKPRPYLYVSQGIIIVEFWDKQQEAFTATEQGAKDLMEYLNEKNVGDVMCSSSIDFPTEYGGEVGITNIIRGFKDNA